MMPTATVRQLTAVRKSGAGVDAAFDAHRRRAFRSLVRLPRFRRAAGRLWFADNGGRGEGLLSAGLGLARLKL
jgi:hypothetical protein